MPNPFQMAAASIPTMVGTNVCPERARVFPTVGRSEDITKKTVTRAVDTERTAIPGEANTEMADRAEASTEVAKVGQYLMVAP